MAAILGGLLNTEFNGVNDFSHFVFVYLILSGFLELVCDINRLRLHIYVMLVFINGTNGILHELT